MPAWAPAPDRSRADMLLNWLRLPHCAGSVPVSWLADRSSACNLASPDAPLQLAGRLPVSLQAPPASGQGRRMQLHADGHSRPTKQGTSGGWQNIRVPCPAARLQARQHVRAGTCCC